MRYAIGSPRKGCSLNGNKWLLDDKDKLITFDTYEEAVIYVKEEVIKDDPEDYVFSIVDEGGEADFPIQLTDMWDGKS